MEVITIRVGHDNLSYLIIDRNVAALVDPGMDPREALSLIEEKVLILEYVILTHHHIDHSSSTCLVVDETGATVIGSVNCLKELGIDGSIATEGEPIILGSKVIDVIETPGHTPGGICLKVDEKYLISGDTLFIGDCGRCDLPGGSLKEMFESLQKIKGLKDDLIVLPGHDYGPMISDSLGDQKRTNPVLLARDLVSFSSI